MTRQEQFAAAKAQADQEAAERKEKGNFTPPDYEDVFYAPLETDKVKVFRFIGLPYTIREDPSDPKMVLSSWITGDDKKPFICKWEDNKDWILWKIYNSVMKYTWDKDAINPATGKAGVKVYTNAIKYPSIFNRVRYNGKDDPSPYEKGWAPTKAIVMNCISRDDYAWHKENKSFKVIAKKQTSTEDETGNVKIRSEAGVGVSAYDMLLKSAVEEHGAWDDFDIAVRKLDDDPWYEVYSFFDARKIQKDLECEMNGDPLTEEELSWKKFDLDKLNKVTSYRKIQNRLGKFIKEVDGCLKTNYTEELAKLVEDEKAYWDAQKKEEADDATDEVATPEPKKEELKVEQKEEPKVRTRTAAPDTAKLDMWQVAKNAGWKAIDELKEKYSDLVFSITADTIVYKDDEGNAVPKSQTIPCTDCDADTYEILDFCPKCGARFVTN